MDQNFHGQVGSVAGKDQYHFNAGNFHSYNIRASAGGPECPTDAKPAGCGGGLRKTTLAWLENSLGDLPMNNLGVRALPPVKLGPFTGQKPTGPEPSGRVSTADIVMIVLSLFGSFVAALVVGFVLSWLWLWIQAGIVVAAVCFFAFMLWISWGEGDLLGDAALISWALWLPAVFLILPLSVPATAALAALVVPPCCWLSIRASRIGRRDRFLGKTPHITRNSKTTRSGSSVTKRTGGSGRPAGCAPAAERAGDVTEQPVSSAARCSPVTGRVPAVMARRASAASPSTSCVQRGWR